MIFRATGAPTARAPVCVCVLLIALTLGATACSSHRFIHVWNDRYVVARRAQDEGKLDEAQRHYDQLLKHAPNEEARRLIKVSLADLALGRGKVDEAYDAYTQVWQSTQHTDEHGARSLYQCVLIMSAHRGRPDEAMRLRRLLMARFAEYIWAERAMEEVRDHLRARGEFKALDAELAALYPKVKTTALADNLLFERALLAERDLKDDAEALKRLMAVYDHDPEGPLADDAIWERARIFTRQQDWPRAITALSRLARDRETSWFIGTYDSEYADEARLELGRIYADRLRRYPDAIKQLEAFIKEFPDSLLRDDAAWEIVRVRGLMGERKAYDEALRAFAEAYPESRYARLVPERLSGPLPQPRPQTTPADDDDKKPSPAATTTP